MREDLFCQVQKSRFGGGVGRYHRIKQKVVLDGYTAGPITSIYKMSHNAASESQKVLFEKQKNGPGDILQNRFKIVENVADTGY